MSRPALRRVLRFGLVLLGVSLLVACVDDEPSGRPPAPRPQASESGDAGESPESASGDAGVESTMEVTLDGTERLAIDGEKYAARVLPSLHLSVTGKSQLYVVNVSFPDSSGARTFDCGTKYAGVSIEIDGIAYGTDPNAPESCSIEVQEVGPVGGRVRASFDAELVDLRNVTGRTRHVSGKFDVVRRADTE